MKTKPNIRKIIGLKKESKKPQIVSNRIKTPDGTILISRHVHDYVGHNDSVTGGSFAVDGGHEYLKRNFSGRYEELSVFTNDHFELIRYVMEWGINGRDKLQYRTLCKMSNSHIEAVLETQTQVQGWPRKMFIKELAYRKKKGILIEDQKITEEA